MLEFLLSLILAVFTGQVSMASAISSDAPRPDVAITWPCNEETCFVEVRMGP